MKNTIAIFLKDQGKNNVFLRVICFGVGFFYSAIFFRVSPARRYTVQSDMGSAPKER